MNPSQFNELQAAWNSAQKFQNGVGGGFQPTGSNSQWSIYNNLLDKYGTGNGSSAGVGTTGSNAGYNGGIGYNPGGSVVLGGTGSTGGPINFNLNPQPQGGSGTFGAVPGAIGAPPSLWDETNANVPGIPSLTGQTSSLIGSQLSGNLSPSTISSLTDTAASRGVSLGQGGSTGLTNEILLKTLGLTHEQLQQQGMGNYMNFLGATSSLQQKPELLAEIASRNATMAAAPNPTLASNYLMGLSRGSGGTSRSLRNPLNDLMGGGYSGGGWGTNDANIGQGVDQATYDRLYNQPQYRSSIPGYNSPSTSTSSFTGDNSLDFLYNQDIPDGTYMGADSYYAPGFGPRNTEDNIWE